MGGRCGANWAVRNAVTDTNGYSDSYSYGNSNSYSQCAANCYTDAYFYA